MFFRESSSKKFPKCVLQLVENKRDGQRVRQRLVISLGYMKVDKSIRRAVSDRIEDILKGHERLPGLTQKNKRVEELAQEIAHRIRTEGKWNNAKRAAKVQIPDGRTEEVFVDEIETIDDVELGPELVSWQYWNSLGFSQIFQDLGFSNIEIKTAAVSIINRLINPRSENNLSNWLKNTALPELLNFKPEQISKTRFYRVADKIIKNQAAIEKRLASNEQSLFNLNRKIYLYDLTNTYFEGTQATNSKAAFSGKSKEKRNDCPQVAIGLIVDENGFPIKHKIFEGNTSDSITLPGVISSLEEDTAGPKPTIIIDSGMSSDKHLDAIREAGFDYIATTKRTRRINYADIFENEELFWPITDRKDKKEVKIYKQDFESHTLLFCKSEGRKDKESAIKEKAHQKLIVDLNKLTTRLAKGKLKDELKIQQTIGRIRERHSRVAKYYNISYDPQTKTLRWPKKSDKLENILDGCYIIKTSRKDLSDKEIWSVYMTLLKVESAFRYLKTTLGLRPNFHYKEDRVDSHIFITILAYHILNSIEYTLKQCGDYRMWPTIKQSLETHRYVTSIIPTVKGPVISLRKPGKLNAEQQEIYDSLSIKPKDLPTKKIYA